jgi:5-methylcytosine-specific restriction endonuclease McrA
MHPSIRPRSLPTLIHELDEVFSVFIRKRDLPGGVGKCFICGNKILHSQAHCGHYVHRSEMPTRYDEMNGHAICMTCNVFDEEHQEKYALKMVLTYGHKAVVDLEQKARGLQKFTRHELEELIEYYRSENRIKK